MNIVDDFKEGIYKEVTDPVDDAAKHDIEKDVGEISGDAEKTIQLGGNAIHFVQLDPNLVPTYFVGLQLFMLWGAYLIIFIFQRVSIFQTLLTGI